MVKLFNIFVLHNFYKLKDSDEEIEADKHVERKHADERKHVENEGGSLKKNQSNNKDVNITLPSTQGLLGSSKRLEYFFFFV
jgi:hypothetical protein